MSVIPAVCPFCFRSGAIISYQAAGRDPRPAYWSVRVNVEQRAVVLGFDGTRATGPLECRSDPCIRSQARPVRSVDVVVASLRERRKEAG